MAVQAQQYPSNLLFHDRGEPERKKEMDMPKPQQLAGVSPGLYFAAGGATVGGNRRKRSREAMAAPPTPAAVKEEYINLFALQQQQPAQFFNIHGGRVASASPSPAPAERVSTGLRLALDEQQQRHQQQMTSSLCYAASTSPSPLGSLSDDLAGQMKQHGEELDRFIRDQGEQLRRAIADRVRHHNRTLLVAADKSASRRLREKSLEAEREARRGAELEERLARLRAEAAAWQAKALSEQATAVALHAQLQQASCEELAADGGEARGPAESSSSAYVDPRRAGSGSCQGCRGGPATVVLLPCRHLSLCGGCVAAGEMDAALACPVCRCVRTGSVEAILS
ncbi:BOI-related E3 ubiquitin-protein ligase 1 [Lolium perenne]|uniref:BOI-related E3 ubiquitin-protein ligase 1 n=1 Tax=Lolium perenne TaxID=4522 RepID=UPI0021EA8BEA|nr:BOI-related E3 ubiquitin-protein ligase 1-like [Lolium perenne]